MPTFKRDAVGTPTDVANVRRWDGSAWVAAGFARRWTGSAWEDVWPLLTLLLTNRTVSNSVLNNTTTYAGIRFHSGGALQERKHTSYYSVRGEWMSGGNAADYSVRRTNVSGVTPTGGTAGTWYALSTTRDWYVTASAGGGLYANTSDYAIKLNSSGAIVASARITLQASSEGIS